MIILASTPGAKRAVERQVQLAMNVLIPIHILTVLEILEQLAALVINKLTHVQIRIVSEILAITVIKCDDGNCYHFIKTPIWAKI